MQRLVLALLVLAIPLMPAELPAQQRSAPEYIPFEDWERPLFSQMVIVDRTIYLSGMLQVDGMREPAPADFLGGADGMPVGHTSYFTVDLAPGHYAWVSAPAANARMLREFVVQ